MKVLIKQARIFSSNTPLNGLVKDILVTEGTITRIADEITDDSAQLIRQEGLCASCGWMDVFADFADPGQEYRETLESGANAAAAGGFTDLMLIPNTKPVVDNKSQVEYIVQRSKDLAVNLHPVGAITKMAEGNLLSEMYDMRQAGAIAFSDGTHPVQSPGILLKALQYILAFDGTLVQLPDDNTIGTHGLVNEGIMSTQLGLPGKPALAEELMIARDIELVKYTGSRIHFTGISTGRGIELVAAAKAAGLRVSCSVTPYHLAFCEEDLFEYDSNLKVNPPLRSRTDMMALRAALQKGMIDCIASHHMPQNWDGKTCEFEYARYGMTGLETLFAVVNTIGCPADDFVQMQTVTARQLFGMEVPELAEGRPACITLFEPEREFIYREDRVRSGSKNSPFLGKPLKGRVTGIINKNRVVLNPA